MVSSNEDYLKDSEVFRIVKDIVSQTYFFAVDEISSDTTFDQDLLTDSVTYNEFIDSVEEDFTSRSFSFKIDTSERTEVETVGDLIQLVCRRVCDPKESIKDV